MGSIDSLRSQSIIAALCERHQWQLLARDAWGAQLAARISIDDAGEEELRRGAVNLYCEAWYAACQPGHPQRDRAYEELARYLYDLALAKYREADLAAELTQDAILLVAEQLDRCRHPGAFMAFMMMKLWNAATTHFRRRNRQQEHTAPLPEPEEDVTAALHDVTALTPETTAIQQDDAQRVLRRMGEILREAPRAQKQIQAVLLKFLCAWSDEEIADELQTDVANVHVLRSRGLKRLRGDALLQKLVAEI